MQVSYVAGQIVPHDGKTVDQAICDGIAVRKDLARLTAYDRAAVLDRACEGLRSRAESLARSLADEAGYLTYEDMLLEVQRATEVLTLAAAQTRVGFDETMALDAVDRGRGAIGLIRRQPIGLILGIGAFNGPLLIPTHKIVPAIMAGAPILFKPAPAVPKAAMNLARIFVEAGWPAQALSVLNLTNEGTVALIKDPRIPVISFTGGIFGWKIKEMAPNKHVHLELGGVGATIIAADASIARAASECAAGGFVRSGQSCISVQRLYVHDSVLEQFVERLSAAVRELSDRVGGSCQMVNAEACARVEGFIADALSKGATLMHGGKRLGTAIEPTLLTGTTADMRLMREEVFGPVIAVQSYAQLDQAIDEVNAVSGAIHHGIYTADLDTALRASDQIHAAGVIINGPCTWRVDSMPYGGVGNSGFGREGLRHAVFEFTEPKAIVIRPSA